MAYMDIRPAATHPRHRRAIAWRHPDAVPTMAGAGFDAADAEPGRLRLSGAAGRL